MTDKIGPVNLDNVEAGSFSESDNETSLRGQFNTRREFNELKELFALSKNTSIIQKLGGHYVCFDTTPENQNKQYCLFDHDKGLDGWYCLRGFRFIGSEWDNHWGFGLSMFFLGTDRFLKREYDMRDVEDETNDWEPGN